MRRLKLRNLTICLCIICVVAFSVTAPIVRVSALAEEIPAELVPVFDTQIYQFTDYVEESLTDPQKGILYLLLGAWVCSQGGMNEYELIDPYTTSDGVRGWLKSTGITLYNQMLSFTGGHIYDPITGTDLTPLLSGLAGYALGAATKASKYQTENDFLNDVETSDHYFVPYDPVLQQSINAYFGRKGGLWNWQFNDISFDSDLSWSEASLGAAETSYDNLVSDLRKPLVHFNDLRTFNSYSYTNIVCGYPENDVVLFYDIDDGYYRAFYYNNPEFNDFVYFTLEGVASWTYRPSNVTDSVRSYTTRSFYIYGQAGLSFFDTVLDAVRYIMSDTSTSDSQLKLKKSDLIKHVYVGSDWAHAQEIFNLSDLNFAQNDSPSYNQVPDNTLLDIKGLLVDILDNTNLFQIVVDNLFKPDGTSNIDLPTIKVSINLPDTNSLPVNLNDVSEIIDNSYLNIVKERAKQASETIGEYVAFWHNCDPEVVYVSLGAILVIAIGAFIGKWGHS